MKSIPIVLDRLLSNPSFERVSGKLVKVFDDETRIILELKNKKLQTLLGPFPDADWPKLVNKDVVAFVKQGEPIRVYDLKAIPKAGRNVASPSSGASASSSRTPRKVKSEATTYAPKVKWKKYAEGRMVGEPVKLSSMERGLGLEQDLLEQIFEHLAIAVGVKTRVVSYLDFRKVFHFLCDPSFKTFMNGYVPREPKKIEDSVEEEAPSEVLPPSSEQDSEGGVANLPKKPVVRRWNLDSEGK